MRLVALVALFCCLPSLATAAPPAPPKITETDAGTTGITLTFDQPMLTWNERGNLGAIRMQPDVSCQWYWADDTTLRCRTPDNQSLFHEATAYHLSIGHGLWSQAGMEMLPRDIVAETRRPELNAEIRDWASGIPRIRLMSSQQLTPESITQAVALTFDNQKVNFRVVPLPENSGRIRNGNPHVFDVQLLDLPTQQGELRMHIRPGLRSTEGFLPGTQDKDLLIAAVNEPFRLRDVVCQRGYNATRVPHVPGTTLAIKCDPGPQFVLLFSRKPSAAAIAAIQSSLPAGLSLVDQKDVPNYWSYDRESGSGLIRSPSAPLYLKSGVAATTLHVVLAEGLLAEDGARLSESANLALSTGDYEPGIEIKPTVLVAPAGSSTLPEFNARNFPTGPTLVRMGIGDRTQLQASQLQTSGPRNVVRSIPLPKTPDSIREHGGLVFAGAQDDNNLAYAVAYAPFNVLVSDGDDQLLVWASTWGESRNLAGASVELLSIDHAGNEQILGRTTTDSEGVALLDIPSAVQKRTIWGELPRLVRVTHAGQRTVVPVWNYYDTVNSLHHNSTRKSAHGYGERFDSGSTRNFGVSDRPLYRPGESVSYRVWFRHRTGNRLLRADKSRITMTLRSINGGKTLQSWSATLDELGSISGQLHLPALLTDDYYCIGVRVGDDDVYPSDSMQGACFQVARFEAQSLWAQIKTDRKTVLAGQDLGLQLDSGYFSGDAAANVAIRFSSLLIPKRLEDTYPDFAAYTFIDPFVDPEADGGIDPLRAVTMPTATDRNGKAHFTWHLPAVMHADSDTGGALPFGLLEINASVSIPGKASASSGTAAVTYSQYTRFVGLKSEQWWLPIDRDPQLEAVVITHDGHAIAGQTVQVGIESADDEETETPTLIGHCVLVTGQVTPCAFRAPRTGRYRFRASVEGAAPTVLTRYIGGAAPVETTKTEAQASLTLLHASNGTSPARIKLHQPYPRANVLFTLEYVHVVSHWVQAVTATDSEIEVPVHADWAPGVTLHALIRARDPASAPGSVGSHTVDAVLDLDIPKLRNDAITVSLDRPRAAPGQDVVLRLINTTATMHHATIALVDDSIYQQASDVNEYADPAGDGWLGSLQDWDQSIWYGLEGWSSFSNPFFVAAVKRTRIRRAVDYESTSPVTTLTRSEGSGLNTNDSFKSKNLERIEVVGSRIKRVVDYFNRTPAVTVLKRGTNARPGKPLSRVRSAFADSAYWNPDMPLAPGETRELRIHLPDNLTRWRVLVWASDDSDGFALTQTTLETALPIELRAGVPGQLYVGDQATASVSARNHGNKPAALTLNVQADGAGVQLRKTRQGTVGGNAELSQRIAFAPDAIGDVQILSHANKSGAGDGLSSSVPVLSRMGDEHISQTGWIDEDSLNLPLPSLPEGASAAVLDVQIHRGLDGWRDGWLRDLRDYPHRCWEQTLSRAVGAALAVESGQDKTLWPNAQAEVRDALIVAPTFQDEDGNFRFFIAPYGDWKGSGNPALSAYTLRSFELLQALGFEPPLKTSNVLTGAVQSTLTDFGKHVPTTDYDPHWEAAAQSAGALLGPKLLDDVALDALWNGWAHLSWYGRSELVRALTRKPKFAEQAKAGILRLREAGVQRGLRRVIHDERDFSYFMGSNLRDQCGVVATLYELDTSRDGDAARRSLLRGLQDLYSGGTASLDTQSSAQCLMALHTVARSLPVDDQQRQILLSLGAASHAVTLAPQQDQAHWSQALAKSAAEGSTDTLRLQSQGSVDATLSYSAELRYRLDLQQAKPSAVGMRLERSYQVLRSGAWVDLAKTTVREGDWVRVRLVLDVPAFRHFVAITDIVPGGLVSRDISLSNVGGADLKRIGDRGSWWFDSRQTGQNDVKIYAEQLPPGTHEVFYYAQAVQPGDYFAPPATAELMYGRASRSTTAPSRMVISPALPAAKR